MKSKYTLFSSFIALLLVLVTTGGGLASHLAPDDSLSALYIREGARQIKNILDRREANRAAGVPDDNVYVIDFAEILNNASETIEYYKDATTVPSSTPNDWPSGYNPKKWSDDTKESIRQHMISVNSDPILSGTAIIVGLNLYLGKLHRENDIIEYDAAQKINVRKNSKNTTQIQTKHDELRALLSSIANQVPGGKYIFVAGGYFLHDDINDKSRVGNLWFHQSNGVSKEFPYAPIFSELKSIPSSNVKDKVVTYTNSLLYTLKGLDQRVINLSTAISGPISSDESDIYFKFFDSFSEVIDPSKIKIVYYDNINQLNNVEYKRIIESEFTVQIRVDNDGNVMSVRAPFIVPPGTRDIECTKSEVNGTDAEFARFKSRLMVAYPVDAYFRRAILIAYSFYKVIFNTALCLTDEQHVNAACCSPNSSCFSCRMFGGFVNGIVGGFDIVGSFEGVVQLMGAAGRWAWNTVTRTPNIKDVTPPVIPEAINNPISSVPFQSNDLVKNMSTTITDFGGATNTGKTEDTQIANMGNMVGLGKAMTLTSEESAFANPYNYGWLTGTVVSAVYNPVSIEGILARWAGKLGLKVIMSGKVVSATDGAVLKGLLKVIDRGYDFVTLPGGKMFASIDKDGVIRRLLVAEGKALKVLEHADLIAKAKDLPGLTPALKNVFEAEFADPKHYDILAKFVTGEASVDVWQAMYRAGSSKRVTGAIVKRVTTLVSNNRFGWGTLQFEKVFTKMLKEVPPGKVVKESIDEVEELGEGVVDELIEQSVSKSLTEEEFLEVFEQLNRRSIENSEGVLSELCCESQWKFVGAEMVLRAVRSKNYWAVIEGFERSVNEINGRRYIDILLTNETRIEVKSWIKMYKPTFVVQFIKKDLTNANSLDRLMWIFDKKYEKAGRLLKDDILEVLMSATGREALKKIPANKANQLLRRSDLQDITNLDKDEIADAFIEYFIDPSNFNNMFKMQ